MGCKERVERLKASVHEHILDAAMCIVKSEGLQSLNIRKIADIIEYSPPVIYSYFLNKEAILIELSKRGYGMLINHIERDLQSVSAPKQRLEVILTALLDFAIKEKELYQLMFTVGMGLEDVRKAFPGLVTIINKFREEIQQLAKADTFNEEFFLCKYLTFVSFIHGLVSVNFYFKDVDRAMNDKILKEAVGGMINSIDLYSS
jgi:AcrR family transcriptional regulator